MTPETRLENALHSPQPAQSLRAVVLELSGEGHTKEGLYELLEKLLLRLRAQKDVREADEDIVLDVMDALTGWCHPDAALLPDNRLP